MGASRIDVCRFSLACLSRSEAETNARGAEMALMQCPECGREVSTHASSCPGCGYPLQPQPPTQSALQSTHVWGRVVAALGAWLVTPWIAKLIVALAAYVLAYFMFTGSQ